MSALQQRAPSRDDFAALLEESFGYERDQRRHGRQGHRHRDRERPRRHRRRPEDRRPRRRCKEFAAPRPATPTIKVGDEVEVYRRPRRERARRGDAVARQGPPRGEPGTSSRRRSRPNERVNGVIFGRVKGGFTVDLDGAVAFLPRQPGRHPPGARRRPADGHAAAVPDPQDGPPPRQHRRVAPRRPRRDPRRAALRARGQSLDEGQVIDGVVKNITDYGAFVDLGGIDGLLHVTDMAGSASTTRPRSLNIGETVKVQIIRINRETQRISLGMKQLEADPWEGVARQVSGRRQVQGPRHQHHRLRRLRRAGAGHRGPGPRLRDELDQEERPPGQDRLHLARRSRCMVLEVDAEKRRISLGLKQAHAQPVGGLRREAPGRHRRSRARSRTSTEFGLFIGLDGDVDGMVHLSDLAWNRAGRGGASTTSTQGRDGQGPGARRRRREGAHLARHQAARGRPVRGGAASIKQGRGRHLRGARGQGRRHRGEGRRHRPDRLHPPHRPRPRPRRAAPRALRRRREGRCHGHRSSTARPASVTCRSRRCEIAEEKEAMAQYGSSDSGASLGDILGAALNKAKTDKK